MAAVFSARKMDEKATNASALAQAIEIGNITELKTLLDAGADANATTESGMTALMRAAANGHLEMARLLIKHGAEIDARRSDGFSAFVFAVFFGHSDLVRLLIEKGADIEVTTRAGASASAWASVRGFREILELLGKAQLAKETAAGQSNRVETEIAPKHESPDQPNLAADPETTLETQPVATITAPPKLNDSKSAAGRSHSERGAFINSTNNSLNLPWTSATALVAERDAPTTIDVALAELANMTSTHLRLAIVTLATMLICGVTTLSVMEMLKPLPESTALIHSIATLHPHRVSALPIAEGAPATETHEKVKPVVSNSPQPNLPFTKTMQPTKAAAVVTEKITTGPVTRRKGAAETQAQKPDSSLSSPTLPMVTLAERTLSKTDAQVAPDSQPPAKSTASNSQVDRPRAEPRVRDASNHDTSETSIVVAGGSSQSKRKVIQWP